MSISNQIAYDLLLSTKILLDEGILEDLHTCLHYPENRLTLYKDSHFLGTEPIMLYIIIKVSMFDKAPHLVFIGDVEELDDGPRIDDDIIRLLRVPYDSNELKEYSVIKTTKDVFRALEEGIEDWESLQPEDDNEENV